MDVEFVYDYRSPYPYLADTQLVETYTSMSLPPESTLTPSTMSSPDHRSGCL